MLRVLVLLAACAPNYPDGPAVRVEPSGYEESVDVWNPLGFHLGDRGRECLKRWMDVPDTDCHITIHVYREDGLAETGSAGLADRANRRVIIDSRWTGRFLVHVGAHEFGHLLLNTGDHTTEGVMSSDGSVSLSDDDIALACSAGWCPL
jgi:hypothetical protein